MKEATTIPIEGGNLKSLANTTTSTAGKELGLALEPAIPLLYVYPDALYPTDVK